MNYLKRFFQNIRQRYHIRDYKFSLVILVLAISIIGVFVVGSAQASSQNRQLLGVILGVIAMAVISLIDYEWVLGWYWILYLVNIGLLISVLLFGVPCHSRWCL